MEPTALLRAHYDDQPPLDAARLERMRQRLEARVAAGPSPKRSVARARPRAAALAGARLALAIITTVLVIAPPGTQRADAAEVLQRAQQWASTTGPAGPGTVTEFRSVDLHEEQQVVYRREWTALLRAPRGDGPWTRKKTFTSFTYAYGDRAAATPPDPSLFRPRFETSSDASFPSGGVPGNPGVFGPYPAGVQNLPRDPAALLERLREDPSHPGTRTAWTTLIAAETVLTSGVADRSLQAAVFAALQRVPDLVVADRHAVDLYGRTGVAIAVEPGTPDPGDGDVAAQLIIDPVTGRFLGVRATSIRASGPIPAGADLGAVAVKVVADDPADWIVRRGDVREVGP